MTGTAQDAIAIAAQEVDVCWRTDTPRILAYFHASTGHVWTKKDALHQSWCTHYAMWVLIQAGVAPLPPVGTPPPDYFSTARFGKSFWPGHGAYNVHRATHRRYQPKPGDLYYLPHMHDHIGFIETVTDGKHGPLVTTLNGNGFDMQHANLAELVDGKPVLGGGFVSRGGSANLLDGKPHHRDACYLEVPGP